MRAEIDRELKGIRDAILEAKNTEELEQIEQRINDLVTLKVDLKNNIDSLTTMSRTKKKLWDETNWFDENF